MLKVITSKSTESFNYLAGINRGVRPSQVSKLAESVRKMGCTRPLVCALIDFLPGGRKLYIIDGQHLFNALIRLDERIDYVLIEVKNKVDLVEKIALLNNSSKSWTLADYILSWGSIKSDYVRLSELFNIYDFELSFLASVLHGKTTGLRNNSITSVIKKGEFEIKDEPASLDILNKLTDVLNIIPRMDRMQNKYVCDEFVNFVLVRKSYNHSRFLAALQKNKKQFVLATQTEGALQKIFQRLSS